jgi:hypothetical protein
MADDVFHALCALVAFFVPMGFAWWVVSRTVRRHERRARCRDR